MAKALAVILASLPLFPFWYLHLLMALDDFVALVILGRITFSYSRMHPIHKSLDSLGSMYKARC